MKHARVIESDQARIETLRGRTIAVLGYGSQGHAHALNLRDSGLDVIVAQRPGSPRYEQAVADGFEPLGLEDATRKADLLIFALPDDAAPQVYRQQIAPHLRAGKTLGFIHGFCIHYRLIEPPADVDVVLVAPKAQGRGVRRLFEQGRGPAVLVGVHQDASGHARETALAWAAGLGAAHALILETSFAEETETDLFGEQAVLCGGLSHLIIAAFETLVEAGYPAELAWFECCYEVKLLADLIHEHGISGMRERISSTARFGDLTRGPRVIDDHVRANLRQILDGIRSAAFAREFLDDQHAGGAKMRALLDAGRRHPIEQIGTELRQRLAPDKRRSEAGNRDEETGNREPSSRTGAPTP